MDSQLDTTQVRKAKKYANASINDFLDNVDDLTKAIKDVETPDIARVRAKVKMALERREERAGGQRLASARPGAARSPRPPTATCATIPGRSSASRPWSESFSA